MTKSLSSGVLKTLRNGLRLNLSEYNVECLKSSDFVAFSIFTPFKTKIICKNINGKPRAEEMLQVPSEIINPMPGFKAGKTQASIIFNPASLNIEWLSVLSLIEAGDEFEVLWCMDWTETPTLTAYGLHYDCMRVVIHKQDHRQYHIRLHTVVGDSKNRLIKVFH